MLRCLFQRFIGLSRFSGFIRALQTVVLPTSDLSSVSHCFHKDIKLDSLNRTNFSDYFNTYTVLLRQCIERKSLTELRRIHLHMKKSGFPHLSLGNKLIHAYLKCDSVADARNLFDEMPQRHIVMWNSLISAYIRRGLSDEAIRLFKRMSIENVIADEFTFSSVFKAFSNLGLLHEGRKAHGLLVVLGLEVSNAFVGSALVDMYAIFGRLRDARLVSDRILEKDVVLLTALIVGCTQHGENGEALEVFRNMIKEGIKANDFTFSSILIACGNSGDRSRGIQVHGLMVKSGCEDVVACRTSLLTMYSKCGLIDDSLKVFERFPDANLVSWTALITGLVQNGREESSLLMFKQMIGKSLSPNAFTLSSVLRACSILAMFEQGQQIHCIVLKTGLDRERYVGATLIDVYGKCGSIDMARSVFVSLDELDVVLVNSMIYSYAQSGYGHEAVELFDQMQHSGIEPNDVTVLNILSACSNAGLLEEGYWIFSSLQNSDFELSTDHYACMVDLLGRAGRLEDAEQLITQVKNPDVVLWRTLLSACRIHGEVKMAKRATTRVLELDPGDEGTHVLLSNVYASAGKWSEVTNMKITMKEMKLKKNPAMSWIEVDRVVHTFTAGDLSHPRATEINDELERLKEKIETLGYVPDVRFVLQYLDEEEKKRSLYYHSEKLAIAFGLLSKRNSSTCIRIYKNLRVCGDCHNWIKFVSKVAQKEIIARDAKRFHHFRDGLCSCGDYW